MDERYDLWSMDEFQKKIVEPEPNNFVRRGRCSLFTDDDPPGATNFIKSDFGKVKILRGKPYKYKNGENLPGGNIIAQETMRDLRNVMGVGFSNELIERAYKAPTTKKQELPANNESNFVMPNLGFKPSQGSSRKPSPMASSSKSSSSSRSSSALSTCSTTSESPTRSDSDTTNSSLLRKRSLEFSLDRENFPALG